MNQFERYINEGGIPRELVSFSKIEVEHLICPICLNILWKPVACGQDRCFQLYCHWCIKQWLKQDQDCNSSFNSDGYNEQQVDQRLCPKCGKAFLETSIPIISNILEDIKLSCLHQNCKVVSAYRDFQKHVLECPERRLNCPGCLKELLFKDFLVHSKGCELVESECEKCLSRMTRKEQKEQHTTEDCVQSQFQIRDVQLQQIKEQVCQISFKQQEFEKKLNKISKGEFQKMSEYRFKTSFSNYSFQQVNEQCLVRLIKQSYNNAKQKKDFLHFYINLPIRTQSVVGQQWSVKITNLTGSLLLGICSNLSYNSIDIILNRFGEVKKKEQDDNKYRHLRRVNFTFAEEDCLVFQFLPLSQTLRVTNETKHLICRFEKEEILEMGEQFFSFFSLDTQGDQLLFQ